MSYEDSFRADSERKMNHEIARIILSRFESNDTKKGIKFSIGGAYIHPYFRYVSRNALALLRERQANGNNLNDIDNVRGVRYRSYGNKGYAKDKQLIIEHMIPIESAYRFLSDLYKRNQLTLEAIERLIPSLQVALITYRENEMLKPYNDKMPEGVFDGLARYRAVGMNDIWADDFTGKPVVRPVKCNVCDLRQREVEALVVSEFAHDDTVDDALKLCDGTSCVLSAGNMEVYRPNKKGPLHYLVVFRDQGENVETPDMMNNAMDFLNREGVRSMAMGLMARWTDYVAQYDLMAETLTKLQNGLGVREILFFDQSGEFVQAGATLLASENYAGYPYDVDILNV